MGEKKKTLKTGHVRKIRGCRRFARARESGGLRCGGGEKFKKNFDVEKKIR